MTFPGQVNPYSRE